MEYAIKQLYKKEEREREKVKGFTSKLNIWTVRSCVFFFFCDFLYFPYNKHVSFCNQKSKCIGHLKIAKEIGIKERILRWPKKF